MAPPEPALYGAEGELEVERRLFIGGLPAKATEQVPAAPVPAAGAPVALPRPRCDRCCRPACGPRSVLLSARAQAPRDVHMHAAYLHVARAVQWHAAVRQHVPPMHRRMHMLARCRGNFAPAQTRTPKPDDTPTHACSM